MQQQTTAYMYRQSLIVRIYDSVVRCISRSAAWSVASSSFFDAAVLAFGPSFWVCSVFGVLGTLGCKRPQIEPSLLQPPASMV